MSFDPISAGIQGVGQVWGSKVQAKASRKASEAQERMAKQAADLQARIAEEQLAYQREQSKNLRIDTERARLGNYGQWLADLRNQAGQWNVGNRNQAGMFNVGNINQAGMFNVGNRLTADLANAEAFNRRGEFNVTRADANAIRTARALDMSNLRAMMGGSAYAPARFGEIDPLERVTAGTYTPGTYTPEGFTPEEAPYVPGYDPNAPRT